MVSPSSPKADRIPGWGINPPAQKERDEVVYTVEDTNAGLFHKKKVHTIAIPQANGKFQHKEFSFAPNERKKMSQETALLFLDISSAFRVRNSKDQIVRPRRSGKGEGERTVTLKQHELVVPVTAVLKEALYDIARNLPGGESRFTDWAKTNREDLEEFIISGGLIDEDEDGLPIDTVAA